jgi:hypothetical protein
VQRGLHRRGGEHFQAFWLDALDQRTSLFQELSNELA